MQLEVAVSFDSEPDPLAFVVGELDFQGIVHGNCEILLAVEFDLVVDFGAGNGLRIQLPAFIGLVVEILSEDSVLDVSQILELLQFE